MAQPTLYHKNIHYSNQTLYWSGSDTQELWKNHMNNSDTRKYLESMGWDNEYAIEYKFNSCGFRDDEFDQRPNCIAIGCSFTEGVGLQQENIWPTKLTEFLGIHVWNLGVGAGAADTCFRILDHYVKLLNPQAVFLLVPPLMRVELHIKNEVVSYVATDIGIPSEIKQWFSYEANGITNRYKNILAMKQICADSGIKLYIQDSTGNISIDNDVARDLMHFGKDTQKFIASNFYKEYIYGNS